MKTKSWNLANKVDVGPLKGAEEMARREMTDHWGVLFVARAPVFDFIVLLCFPLPALY